MNQPAPISREALLNARRDQYEYLVESVTKIILAGIPPYTNETMMVDFNKRGAEGWEMVLFQVAPASQTSIVCNMVWKRKIVETMQ